MAAGKTLKKLFTILLFPVNNHVMWFQNIYRPVNSHTSGVRLTHSIRGTENHAQSWKSHAYFIKN